MLSAAILQQTRHIFRQCCPNGHCSRLLPQRQAVEALCTVKTSGVTGVEMEALTGVSTALLTIYDMCKAVDKGMELGEIHLVEKTGGKSGHYIRAEGGYV